MSEKKVSGVRTDLSPSEFAAKIGVSKGQTKGTKIKKFFSNLGEIITSLGLFPVLSSNSRRSGHHGGHYSGEHAPAPQQSSSASFRESYHFDPERAYIERMQERAYMDMVDGKGDHECDHEH